MKELINIGSKSEHEAILLDNGIAKIKIIRKGGNPFYDEELEQLVGKSVEITGEFVDQVVSAQIIKLINHSK